MSFLKVAVFVVLSSALFACKPPAPGDKCTGDKAVCSDKTSALTCKDATYHAMSCRGPQGCAKQGAGIACDDTIASLKDGCDEENEVACSVDKKAALECKKGVFELGETCKGPRGCAVDGEKITCDNDIADQGDPCHFDGDYACSVDNKLALKCTSNVMTPLNSCRGAKGCRVVELPAEKKIEFICDDSVAQENDPCDEESEHACAIDKKSILICKAMKFTAWKPCAGPGGCAFDEKAEHFTCDESKAGTGKAVDVKGAAAAAQPHKPAKKP